MSELINQNSATIKPFIGENDEKIEFKNHI